MALWRRLPARPVDPGVPVVSVGSIAVGGSGKTPLAMHIAEGLASRSFKPCIISRGYRRRGNTSPQLVSDGRHVLVGVEEAGDEPYMMAKRLRGVGVVVGKDRVQAAIGARRRIGPDILVLDDGFQYRHIFKQVELVCLDWRTVTGRTALLPLGALREGWSSIKPEHIAVIVMPSAATEPGKAELGRIGATEVFTAYRAEPALMDCEGNRRDVGELAGGAVVVSGIARPQAFEATCQAGGIPAVASIRYDDHHWYSDADAEMIAKVMASRQCRHLVTTEKDVHKLPVRLRQASLVLRADLEIADTPGFWQALERRLNL